MGKKKLLSDLVAEVIEREAQNKSIKTLLKKLLDRCVEAEKKGNGKTKRVPREMTDYQKFYKIEFPPLREMYPDEPAPELMKQVAAKWQEYKRARDAGVAPPLPKGRGRSRSRDSRTDSDASRSRSRSRSRDSDAPARKAPAKKAAAKPKAAPAKAAPAKKPAAKKPAAKKA